MSPDWVKFCNEDIKRGKMEILNEKTLQFRSSIVLMIFMLFNIYFFPNI